MQSHKALFAVDIVTGSAGRADRSDRDTQGGGRGDVGGGSGGDKGIRLPGEIREVVPDGGFRLRLRVLRERLEEGGRALAFRDEPFQRRLGFRRIEIRLSTG